LHGKITIREQNSAAALEVMSRFAADPNWLIYLPPTMSPTETSDEPALLEHPSEAFAYFRDRGINSVVCEEKHMGSRAIVVICKSNDAARKRFRVNTQGVGICYTRTGRPFFNDASVEAAFLDRISNALTKSDFWSRFQTDWLALDCELMPWSAKAQELLKEQYAAVGVGGTIGLAATVAALEQACNSGRDCHDLLNRHQERLRNVRQFVDAYRKYCWTVKSVDDLKLAPFHVLASEGVVHADKDHVWHMRELATVAANDESSLIIATRCKHLDLTDEDSVQSGIAWWHELTVCGGEGMVVKPLDFVSRGAKGLIQPAIKVRGREYLRIIYGPEYTAQENLKRLRARHVNAKRSLALREFSLGIEALERFVRHEPLYKVHECVFGVLALESEPVDPRL
jgi:protein phosphatase